MQKLTTILDWVRYTVSELSKPDIESELVFGHGSLNSFDEAHALVLGILHLPFNLDVSYFSAKLTNTEINNIQRGIEKRIHQKKPVPYITNRAMFMGLEFYVDERVLIPRSPIMEIIDNNFSPYKEQAEYSILDLCCGSGCIGIACAYMNPYAKIIISDIDDGAIEVANINIIKHDIDNQVTAIKSDLFQNINNYKFDIIISNPPYVDKNTVINLPDEFLHEPKIALGSGEDGLDITRRILKESLKYLNEDGILIVEVGSSWDILEQAYPDISFKWHNFQSQAEGVFIMTYNELLSNQKYFT